MKKSEFVQIKGLDLKELKVKARALREEIAGLTLDKNIKKLKDLKMVSKKKKERAQILTVIRQKELLSQLESRVRQEDSDKSVTLSEAKQSGSEENLSKIATSPMTPRNDKKKRSRKT